MSHLLDPLSAEGAGGARILRRSCPRKDPPHPLDSGDQQRQTGNKGPSLAAHPPEGLGPALPTMWGEGPAAGDWVYPEWGSVRG